MKMQECDQDVVTRNVLQSVHDALSAAGIEDGVLAHVILVDSQGCLQASELPEDIRQQVFQEIMAHSDGFVDIGSAPVEAVPVEFVGVVDTGGVDTFGVNPPIDEAGGEQVGRELDQTLAEIQDEIDPVIPSEAQAEAAEIAEIEDLLSGGNDEDEDEGETEAIEEIVVIASDSDDDDDSFSDAVEDALLAAELEDEISEEMEEDALRDELSDEFEGKTQDAA